jgi:site-specific recombinase XerC
MPSFLAIAAAVVPGIVADAGERATRRFLEFFAATIRNRNTRAAYMVAVGRFFSWCEQHRIGQLADIEPLHVAAYIEVLGQDFEKPTVKQHLAAIRMLFDWLVTGQVVATNPAHAVRGPKHVVKTGKTTVLDADQARKLLDSIDTSTVVGLRDRALISIQHRSFPGFHHVLRPTDRITQAFAAAITQTATNTNNGSVTAVVSVSSSSPS